MMLQEEYVSDAVDLLKKLIATPSVSRNEKDAADIMEQPSANMVSNLIVRRTTSGLSTLITMRADLPYCSTLTSIP